MKSLKKFVFQTSIWPNTISFRCSKVIPSPQWSKRISRNYFPGLNHHFSTFQSWNTAPLSLARVGTKPQALWPLFLLFILDSLTFSTKMKKIGLQKVDLICICEFLNSHSLPAKWHIYDGGFKLWRKHEIWHDGVFLHAFQS